MRIVYSYKHNQEIIEEAVNLWRDPQQKIVIGRATPHHQPDINLAHDLNVSRKHAEIWTDDAGQSWIRDLGSKYGTFVDGKLVKGKAGVRLRAGASIQIGKTTLRLRTSEETGATLAEPTRTSQVTAEFTPGVASQLRVSVDCLSSFNYSFYQAGIPFLSAVTVFNEGEVALRDVAVKLVLSGYAESPSQHLPYLAANKRVRVEPLPRLSFDPRLLRRLAEPETVPLNVRVNNALHTNPFEIKVLPPQAWHCLGYETALAGFVMPNSAAIKDIVRRARFELRALMAGFESFGDALDSPDPERELKMVKALYYCLQERYSIQYEYEPRTYDDDWQMVRFHHELLDQLEGTCIDLALLFAACLERVFLDPVVVIVKTGPFVQHALVGCWRGGSDLEQPLIQAGRQLQQWLERGDLILLDSVGFAHGKGAGQSFATCQAMAQTYLDKSCAQENGYRFQYALDIFAARLKKLAPLPFGKGIQFDYLAWLGIFRARQAAKSLCSPTLGARHLVLGWLSLEHSLLRQVLAEFGADMGDEVLAVTQASLPRLAAAKRSLPETNDWRAVMQRAEAWALQRNALTITEIELLKALLETPTQVDKVLQRVGVSRQDCLDKLLSMLGQDPAESALDSSFLI